MCGSQDTPRRVLPPSKGLQADHLVRLGVDDRLVIGHELVGLDGLKDFFRGAPCELDLGAQVLGEVVLPATTSSLGAIESCISIAQKLVQATRGRRLGGDTDARAEAQGPAGEIKWHCQA